MNAIPFWVIIYQLVGLVLVPVMKQADTGSPISTTLNRFANRSWNRVGIASGMALPSTRMPMSWSNSGRDLAIVAIRLNFERKENRVRIGDKEIKQKERGTTRVLRNTNNKIEIINIHLSSLPSHQHGMIMSVIPFSLASCFFNSSRFWYTSTGWYERRLSL